MKLDRAWVTPLAAGAFFLSAVTGVLIFFHLDSGLNKAAHEWLSWALLVGVALHVAANFFGFKRYFSSAIGLGVMGVFVVVLAASFLSFGQEKGEPPFMASVRALSDAPIATLALVAKTTPDVLRGRLEAQGLHPTTDTQSVGDLVGPGMGKRMQVLRAVLQADAGATPRGRRD